MIMKALKTTFLSTLALTIVLVPFCYALETGTHEAINEHIAKNTLCGFSLDSHLRKQLGMQAGVREVVQAQYVWWWIKRGGLYEDEPPLVAPYVRSSNHFHDPLKTWDTAGYKGTFSSSVIWAQDQGLAGFVTGGDFAWKNVREYYYTALTGKDFSGSEVAPTRPQKEIYFASTFRGIGQLMHLVQDASVPAHTRNDTHICGYHYEKAVDKFRNSHDPFFESLLANPLAFDPAILSLTANPLAPIPIARIFDTDKYNEPNPDPSVTYNMAIGLSEFTNANFFSEDTIFSDYPHPAKENTTATLVEQSARDGALDNVWYIQGYTSERLAAYSYLWRNGIPPTLGWRYNLDDYVYADYASQLIPRAVGYSAGLLDYFFRGSIKISVPQSALYASTGDKDAGFTRITLLAVNETSNGEEMSDGTIELVARYRTVAQDPFRALDLQASNDYFYAVVPEATGKRTIPRGTSVELVFDLDQTAIIPINAVDVSLQVVYHGKLGNEDGAVAVGWKSISDPTPVELVNNMDKICLYGNWYDAGSQAAINQVDPDHDGIANWDIYPHDLQNIYVEVSPENNPVQASSSDYDFASAVLNAGKPMQNYILSEADAQLKYSYTATVVKTTTSDVFTHVSDLFEDLLPGYPVKSVVETSSDTAVCDSYGFSTPCTIRHAPPFYPFKDRYLWGPMTTIFDNPKYPVDTSCDWQALQ